ncbi:MAG: hypothetical protein GY804_08280 [Alphaproteobacteria bacterium]|nr:hypothetical protein [Alphaproteobacteria bacterium]
MGNSQEPFKSFTEFSTKVEGTNIHSNTLLCTDYLNHFNEIIMLIEMVPDMPDLLEDCKEWRPKSYKQHFKDIVFSDSALAIEAYDAVPECFKRPFENTIRQMDYLVLKAMEHCEKDIAQDDMETLRRHVDVALNALKQFIEIASSIIHGSEKVMEQEQIDEMLES